MQSNHTRIWHANIHALEFDKLERRLMDIVPVNKDIEWDILSLVGHNYDTTKSFVNNTVFNSVKQISSPN